MTDTIAQWGDLATPYSQEAEEATIGAVLVNPDAFIFVKSFLYADDFFILRHRYVWQALESLYSRKQPIDYLTVTQALKDTGKLSEIGGPAYLTKLLGTAPSSTQAETYGRIVQSKATRRRLMAASDEIKALALDEEIATDDALSAASQKLMDLQVGSSIEREKTFFDNVSEYFDLVEKMMNNPNSVIGIPTGFTNLDNLLMGLQGPDLIVFAGRPGMGKSAFLLSAAMNILQKTGKRVGLFSLEMSEDQVTRRAVSMMSGVNLQHLNSGRVTPSEWARFVEKSGEISRYPFLINDKAGITPDKIRSQMYKWIAKYGNVDVLMVDYLQRMSGGKRFNKGNDKVQEVSYIATQLKEIAREFNIPVVSAAQLSRAVEQRTDKRPQLSDLKESGSIEQEADIVMFLYRDEVYNEATEFPNQADIDVAKHRNGPTGRISLYFEKALTKFMNSAERSVNLSHI